MYNLKDLSIKIKNYKCIGEEEQGFDQILPINLIIGRNNSGKSTLLDLIGYAISPSESILDLGHADKTPEIFISQPLNEEVLKHVFPDGVLNPEVPGRNNKEYRERWIGKKITCELLTNGVLKFMSLDPPFEHEIGRPNHETLLVKKIEYPLKEKISLRLRSDRDIVPEDDVETSKIAENGDGVTNNIQRFINYDSLDSNLVERTLLYELNKIFNPDSYFTRILVQSNSLKKWEIYLEETEKGRVPISHTGSGFKTVFLVLVYLYIIPNIKPKHKRKKLSDYIFLFEELENNLHPALERRLLWYLREFAIENGCHFFLSTHSNVAIDLFNKDEDAQIIHIIHDGKKATAFKANTYIEKSGILDDLDIRASDLLQSNGIVWVEGPSDRIYINRWIEILTDKEILEGTHYLCLFYGGRILSHYSGLIENEENIKEIPMLMVNRNAAIIMDRDKNPDEKINKTKERIKKEIEDIGGFVWTTKGREIENYIQQQAIEKKYPRKKIKKILPNEKFFNYLEKILKGEGEKYKKNKVLFAEEIIPHINKEGIKSTLDLNERLEKLISEIQKWNHME